MSRRAKRPSCRYEGLYAGKTEAAEAYRALIESQYAVVRDNRPGAIRGRDSVYLHDIRVALRRIRTVLKFFGRSEGIRRERGLDRKLKRLCSQLGKTRDLQSRLELLESLRPAENPDINRYVKKCRLQLERGLEPMRGVLRGSNWKKCMTALRRLAKMSPKGTSGGSAGAFCAAALARSFGRIDPDELLRPEDRSAAELHELRKEVRRLRYRIEVAAPALGQRIKALERHFKRVTEALGRIHDIDVIAEMSGRGKAMDLPASLRKDLMTERKRQMRSLTSLLKQTKAEIKSRDMKRYLKRRAG